MSAWEKERERRKRALEEIRRLSRFAHGDAADQIDAVAEDALGDGSDYGLTGEWSECGEKPIIRNPQFDIDAILPVVERLKAAEDWAGVAVVERLYVALGRMVSEHGKLPKGEYGNPLFDAYFRGNLALRVARGEA